MLNPTEEQMRAIGERLQKRFPLLANDSWNGQRIAEYITSIFRGDWTYENCVLAVESLQPSLVWLKAPEAKPLEFVKHTEKISAPPMKHRSHLDIQEEREEKEKARIEAKKKYDLEHPKNPDPYPATIYIPSTARIDHPATAEARRQWQVREDKRQRERAGIGKDGRPTAVYFESGPHAGQVNWRASQERWEEWDKKHPPKPAKAARR
jgi:hypothetical protein